jgi:hypothetical protein
MDKPNTGEILLYQNAEGSIALDVQLMDDTVWLTQEQMAALFGKARSTVAEHIANVYEEAELTFAATCRKFRQVRQEGEREVSRELDYYNLDVVISVGYRVKSPQGTQFRIWATARLKDYIIKGFALNDVRFKTGSAMQYFDELQTRIREIRISEKFFYQKIKDIYTTSIDYNAKDEATISFFKLVQNKLLWAISQQTAAELVYRRVDASLPLLGMLSLDNKSQKINKADISIAKNYLKQDEMKLLGLLVEQYLAFAETMAQQQTPMTMQDWAARLDSILQLNGRELLTHAGKISHQMAIEKSNIELEKYQAVLKISEKEQSLKEIEQDILRLKKNKDE